MSSECHKEIEAIMNYILLRVPLLCLVTGHAISNLIRKENMQRKGKLILGWAPNPPIQAAEGDWLGRKKKEKKTSANTSKKKNHLYIYPEIKQSLITE